MSFPSIPGCAFATRRKAVRRSEVGAELDALEHGHALAEASSFTNLSVFPAVPRRHTGIRVMLTAHHAEQDMVRLARVLRRAAQRISQIR